MKHIWTDGGRLEAGFRGMARDCVVRSISIAAALPYKEVYGDIQSLSKEERRRRKSNPRTGVYKETYHRYLTNILGWKWFPTMFIGQGCKVHLKESELPRGRLVVAVSKHLTAVIDGVIYDTFDPSRGGKRCVYGYYIKTL